MIIKRFLTPKWQHSNPEKRKQALLKLDNKHSDYADILRQLARDPNTEIAQLAISRMHNLQTLGELLNQETNENRQQDFIKRATDILCANESESPSEVEKLGFVDSCQQQELLVHLSNRALGQTIQLAALKKIHSEDDLINIACQSSSPTIRLAAAEKVCSHDKLLSLSKQLRGRDKATYRLVKDRLTQENEKRAKQKENIQFRENLLSAIESLAPKSYFPQYPQKFALLKKQWSEIEEQYRPSELEQRFQQASLLCQALVEEKRAEEQQQQESLAAAEELINTCETLEREIKDFNQNIQSEQIDIPAISALIKTQQIRWKEAEEFTKASADVTQRYNNATSHFKLAIQAYQQYQSHEEQLKQLLSGEQGLAQFNELKTLLQEISWPQALYKPEILDRAAEMLGDEKKTLEANKREDQQKLKTIQAKLEELGAAIEAGSLKTANHLHRDIRQAEKDGALNQRTLQRFKLLAGQLKDLNDWQGFSSSHKKEELCEKMEGLLNKSCDPEDKANQIKLLQEQWKQSGASSNQALWLRFKGASDIAYEPCKAYFAQQAEVRKKNLLERESICQQLDHFIKNNDWQNANWPAAQEIYRSAKQQWKQFSPVDRAKGNAVQNQFNSLLDKLNQLIRDEQTNNVGKKESLIAAAEKLLELSDETEAIEQAKQFQTSWKTIGITPRKKDDLLWKKFRQHCDALFERRDQSRRQVQEDRNKQLDQAKKLCEQLENAASLSRAQILETPDLAAQIDKRLKALTDLPKGQEEKLRKRYNKAAEIFSTLLKQAKLLHKQTQLQHVRTLAEWINTLAQSDEINGDQLEQKWQTLTTDIPSSWLTPFSKRYQAAINKETTPSDADQAKTTKDKSLLCIRMEILAGLESPEETKAERMAYQVSRLSEGMKSAKGSSSNADKLARNSSETAVEIELEWLNLLKPAQTSESQNELAKLEERFELARAALWSHYSNETTPNTSHQQELESSL